MTWLKLSDDFGDECARADLTDAAFRTHVEGLSWVMRRETGGHLDARDVRRFAESEAADAAVTELVAAGFWRREGAGYVVVQHLEHQPEPNVLAARRTNDAERQRRKRAKAAGLVEVQGVSRRDDMRDHPRDPGRGGSGRVGSGTSNYGTRFTGCGLCGRG